MIATIIVISVYHYTPRSHSKKGSYHSLFSIHCRHGWIYIYVLYLLYLVVNKVLVCSLILKVIHVLCQSRPV